MRAPKKKSVNIPDYKERVTIGRVHYWVKSDRYFARDGWTEHIRALVSLHTCNGQSRTIIGELSMGMSNDRVARHRVSLVA